MTGPSTSTPARVDERPLAIADAEAIVIWRGERIGFRELPERIARTDDRGERDGLFRSYLEALDALNPRYESRLGGRRLEASAATLDVDPAALAADLERFVLHSETPYYAALRRYLALVGIEQGDATIADMWHIARGTGWSHWFGPRETARAVAAAGRPAGDDGNLSGWLGTEHMLRGSGDGAAGPGATAVGAAYASIAGSPEWVERELGMAADEIIPFVDFAALVRLWRLRQSIAMLHYEIRLTEDTDPALARAYYNGIVGHMTGVLVPEEMYIVALGDDPWASARDVIIELVAATLVEVLEARHGSAWWREPASSTLIGAVADAASVDDALAELGYDALDWRPVLRQIRTRLIGEMSGYGGPNITTRAGTRKV